MEQCIRWMVASVRHGRLWERRGFGDYRRGARPCQNGGAWTFAHAKSIPARGVSTEDVEDQPERDVRSAVVASASARRALRGVRRGKRDLFAKIVEDGFVELPHRMNAEMTEVGTQIVPQRAFAPQFPPHRLVSFRQVCVT